MPHLTTYRHGNTVMARTELGRAQRVVLAGHLDTVPLNDNFPSDHARRPDVRLRHLRHEVRRGAARCTWRSPLPDPRYDVTYFFYECEEIESRYNGLNLVAAGAPGVAGGGLRDAAGADVRAGRGGLPGHHAGRWSRTHRRAGPTRRGPGSASTPSTPPARCCAGWQAYEARRVTIDGCDVPRGAQRGADQRRGGRQRDPGPLRDRGQLPVRAGPHAGRGARRTCARSSPATRWRSPTRRPARCPGWTRRRRRSSWRRSARRRSASWAGRTWPGSPRMGIPALNFGPGDPNLAHHADEHVETRQDPGRRARPCAAGWRRPDRAEPGPGDQRSASAPPLVVGGASVSSARRSWPASGGLRCRARRRSATTSRIRRCICRRIRLISRSLITHASSATRPPTGNPACMAAAHTAVCEL